MNNAGTILWYLRPLKVLINLLCIYVFLLIISEIIFIKDTTSENYILREKLEHQLNKLPDEQDV